MVPQPPRVVSLWSKINATSQVGREVRDSIAENLKTTLVRIDVSLNRRRARSTARDHYVYKSDVDIDEMNIEDVQGYAKICHDGW